MGNKAVLVLVILAAAIAVFWLLGGADLFKASTPDGDEAAGASDGTTKAAGGAAGAGPAEAEAGGAGPVLFGRGRAQRVGVGGLTGRVMDFRTGKPVREARVVTAGTGYGGETIALQAATDAQGRFRYTDLAAGDAYTVHVAGADGFQRTVAGVAVEAGEVEDLGTLWLGERGVLEGVVTDADGKGIVAARVQVHRGGSLLSLLENITDLFDQLDKDAKPLAAAETQAGGRFRIEEIDPGPHLLVTRAAGFRQAMTQIVMTSQGAAGGALTIQLDPGTPVVGKVVDENGRGIGAARVACLAKHDMNAVFFGRLYSPTDGEGNFRIESPPSDSGYIVIAAADGYPTLFSEVGSPGKPLRLVLLGGAEVQVRVIEKETRKPIEGATLIAMFGEKAEPGADEMSYGSATTDAQGEATFTARPGTLNMIFVTHPDHGGGMWSPALPAALGQTIVEGPKDATVKKPRTSFLFQVAKGVTITGRVLDEGGTPIVGARVSSFGGMGGFGAKTTSDEEGRYVLRGQTPSISMVLARAPGYVQEDPELAEGAEKPEPDANGVLQFDIRMRKGATVAGRVLGPDGTPIAGARVKLGSSGRSGMVSAFMSGGGESITSKDGRYLLDGVPAGEKMQVLARFEGFLDGRSSEFEVKSGEAVQAPDLTLQRGAKFRVKVLSPSGSPAEDARVEVSVERTAERIQWDPQGAFRNFADLTTNAEGTATLRNVPDGGLTLTVSKDGYASARSNLEINRKHVKADEEVTVRLREAFTLRGIVLGEDEQALADASIVALSPPNVTDEHWIPTVSGESGKDGRFALEALPACPLVLEVSAEGHRTQEVPVADLRGEVEVRLEPISPDAEVRLAEIEKELQGIYMKFPSIKDDAERAALIKRMQALQKEQLELKGK